MQGLVSPQLLVNDRNLCFSNFVFAGTPHRWHCHTHPLRPLWCWDRKQVIDYMQITFNKLQLHPCSCSECKRSRHSLWTDNGYIFIHPSIRASIHLPIHPPPIIYLPSIYPPCVYWTPLLIVTYASRGWGKAYWGWVGTDSPQRVWQCQLGLIAILDFTKRHIDLKWVPGSLSLVVLSTGAACAMEKPKCWKQLEVILSPIFDSGWSISLSRLHFLISKMK